jgi:hypothetical protein
MTGEPISYLSPLFPNFTYDDSRSLGQIDLSVRMTQLSQSSRSDEERNTALHPEDFRGRVNVLHSSKNSRAEPDFTVGRIVLLQS